MTDSTLNVTPTVAGKDDVSYDVLREAVDSYFKSYNTLSNLDSNNNFGLVMYHTALDVRAAWRDELSKVSDDLGQQHNCGTCAQFFRDYGNLVTINPNGSLNSVIWPEDTSNLGQYAEPVKAMRKLIAESTVDEIFVRYSTQPKWGVPVTKDWTHFYVTNPYGNTKLAIKVPDIPKIKASKREQFLLMKRTLELYTSEIVKSAIHIASSDFIPRASSVILPNLLWLNDLYNALKNVKNEKVKNNIIWKAVAENNPSFPHIKNNMGGVLLDDIKDGKDLDVIQSWLIEKLAPENYRRFTALATEKQKVLAGKKIDEMGLATAFKRRFATMEDILEKEWTPKVVNTVEAVPAAGGIFASVKTKESEVKQTVKDEYIPELMMSWNKFMTKYLPNAESLEVCFGYGGYLIVGLVSATDPEAKPIIKWDTEEKRNPVSWYTYSRPRLASEWNIMSTWVPVTFVSKRPCEWNGYKDGNFGEGYFLGLENVYDKKYVQGLHLFPEILKPELHEFARVIEHFSNEGICDGKAEEQVAGIMVTDSGMGINRKIKVKTDVGTTICIIDRWD